MMYSSVYSSGKNGTILNTVGLLPVRCKSHTQLQDATDFCIAYFFMASLHRRAMYNYSSPPNRETYVDIMLASWCIRYADKIPQTLNDFLTMSGVTESHARVAVALVAFACHLAVILADVCRLQPGRAAFWNDCLSLLYTSRTQWLWCGRSCAPGTHPRQVAFPAGCHVAKPVVATSS